jgi:hypothetical protein
LIGAWMYYGSPIPNTIIAKSGYTPFASWLQRFPLAPLSYFAGPSPMDGLMLPNYYGAGGWPAASIQIMRITAVLGGFAWLWRGLPWAGRAASFALWLGSFYICTVPMFGWYYPPWAILAYVAVAFVADRLDRGLTDYRVRLVRVGFGLAVAMQLFLLIGVGMQMRAQQRVIENGVRKPIGEWLKQAAKPGDTVFLEPVGYIGYFSGLRPYDYPGLTSREVVDVIRSEAVVEARRTIDRRGGKTYIAVWLPIIRELKPDWLVLREIEFLWMNKDPVFERYQYVRSIDATEAVDQYDILPGREYLYDDAKYVIFRRKP